MTRHMRIDIFSDPVCPWCYLGKKRFDLALAARPHYEPRIFWRPYELNPDLPTEGLERAAYVATRVSDPERLAASQRELQQLGEAIGIRFRFDLIERMPNTRRAHLLIALAGRHGRQAAVKERLMQGYFTEGRDIGDLEQLVQLGAEAGLAERESRNALVLRAGQDGVVAAERHAAVIGITGVPTFIFNSQYTISGAQDVAVMTQVFDQVAAMTVPQEAS